MKLKKQTECRRFSYCPSITVAKYMSGLLENLTGERPDIVHSELKNSETTIDRFRNSKKIGLFQLLWFQRVLILKDYVF